MVNRIVGLDLGYGYTKGKRGEYTFNEPSVVGEKKFVYEDSIQETDLVFDDKYFVGKFAERHSNMKYYSLRDEKYDLWTTEILMKTGLGKIAYNSYINLVSGLPIDFFDLQKESFEKLIENFNEAAEYTIQIGRRNPYKTKSYIMKSKIVPQPLGTAMDYVLDEMGQIARPDIAKKSILVIDPGTYTLGLLGLEAMEVSKVSCSPPGLGTDSAYKLLIEYIKETLNRAPSREDIDKVYLAKEYEGRIITPLIERAFKNLASRIQMEVEGLNKRFQVYLVTGGNAQIIGKYLDLPNMIVVPDSQMANVRGYEKIARRIWKI